MNKDYLRLLRDYYKLLAENATLRFGLVKSDTDLTEQSNSKEFDKLEETMKEKKESEVLTITKERVLSASEKCESAKEILKEIFPEVFKKEYCCETFGRAVERKDITPHVTRDGWRLDLPHGIYTLSYCSWCGKKIQP